MLLNKTNKKRKETSKGRMEWMIKKIGREAKMKIADSKEWSMTSKDYL